MEHAGIKAKPENVHQCIGAQNHTVADCPVNAWNKQDFIVAVQNQQIRTNNGLIRILLPHSNYSAQVWDHAEQKWMDPVFDIVEMKHFDKNFDPFGKQDFALYIKAEVESQDILLVKVKHDAKPHKLAQNLVQTKGKPASLEISGFSEQGEVLFKYLNPAQDID